MYSINGTNISLTKGDTFYCAIEIKNEDGTDYTPQEGDEVKFTLKRNASERDALIEKIIPNDTLILHLVPEDTSDLTVRHYVYDVQLTKENGDVYTFIPESQFILTAEVG